MCGSICSLQTAHLSNWSTYHKEYVLYTNSFNWINTTIWGFSIITYLKCFKYMHNCAFNRKSQYLVSFLAYHHTGGRWCHGYICVLQRFRKRGGGRCFIWNQTKIQTLKNYYEITLHFGPNATYCVNMQPHEHKNVTELSGWFRNTRLCGPILFKLKRYTIIVDF